MREDADFNGYLAARWPTLVRTLVLLGCPEEIASDVALDAVARCRSQWARTRANDDVDVLIHRALLDAWEERRTTPWWRGLGPHDATEDGVEPDVVDTLDQLDTDVRTELVLERHGGLGPAQLVAVAGVEPTGGVPAVPTAEQLRAAVDGVAVLAPPAPHALLRRDQEHQRRRRRIVVGRTVLVAAPVVLVAVGLAWGLSSGDSADEALASVAVDRAENPADVAWYADGRLHLEDVVLDLPAVRQFEPVWDGAAYGDEQGRVVFVDADGTRTILGNKEPAAPLAVSEGHGWVVWAETEGASPRLVVHELSSFGRFAVRDLVPPAGDDDIGPVAVEGHVVYYVDGAGAHAWTVTSGLRLDLGPRQLLDASSRTWVSQPEPGVINVAAAYSAEGFDVRGTGGSLSPDADLVLTRDTSEQASFGPVLIYDAATGADVSVGLGPEDVALAAELGPERTVTYIVARAEDRPENADFVRSSFSGQLELRTCDIDAQECESLEYFPSTGTRPLLAY